MKRKLSLFLLLYLSLYRCCFTLLCFALFPLGLSSRRCSFLIALSYGQSKGEKKTRKEVGKEVKQNRKKK
jgi:hypothetical protein